MIQFCSLKSPDTKTNSIELNTSSVLLNTLSFKKKRLLPDLGQKMYKMRLESLILESKIVLL